MLGTHVGFGAWAVFYQVEDGARGIASGRGRMKRPRPGREPPERCEAAIEAIEDLKGRGLVVLDLRGLDRRDRLSSSSRPARPTRTCAASPTR